MLKLDSSVNDVSGRLTSNCPIQQPVCGIDWSVLSANNIEDYRQIIFHTLPLLSQDLLNCGSTCCLLHHEEIDLFCNQLLSCLSVASKLCFPVISKRARTMPGWNDHVREVRESAMVWNKIYMGRGRLS